MSTPTFARWGTPPHPVELSEAAQAFLGAELGDGFPQPSVDVTDIPIGESELSGEHVAALIDICGESAISRSAADRVMHASGCSLVDYLRLRRQETISVPDAVIRPQDHDIVRELLSYCSNNSIAVVPFGGGTSVVGGLTPGIDGAQPTAWIAISMDQMNRVVEIDEISQTVRVEPGITGPQLEGVLGARGLTLGHLPQSWERASVGGYVATRSAGQASSGFGRSDDMVEAIRVATPIGELELGKATRSAAGPDLRQLFIGSEGALGIITEVTLRVRRTASVTRYEGFMLPDWGSGAAAFREMAQTKSTADVMRLSDPFETKASLAMSGPQGTTGELFHKYLNLRNVAGGVLAILGWEGASRDLVGARRKAAIRTIRKQGGITLGTSVGTAWRQHRFDGPYQRDELLDAGYIAETVETATHWRHLGELYSGVRDAIYRTLADVGPTPYVMCHISHVYETGASLYFTAITGASSDPIAQWQAAKSAATEAMVRHHGTITHHHAVGRDHAPWLTDEIGIEGVRVLRSVKAAVDPARVMNPGVLLPSATREQ